MEGEVGWVKELRCSPGLTPRKAKVAQDEVSKEQGGWIAQGPAGWERTLDHSPQWI